MAAKRRLRRVAKVCLDYGQRVQNSVFECEINPAQLVELKARLFEIVDLDHDSLRFYNLARRTRIGVWSTSGQNQSFDPKGTLDCLTSRTLSYQLIGRSSSR